MDLFSGKGMGCLGLGVLVIVLAVSCPMMISGPSDPVLFETKAVTVAPGELFRVSVRLLGPEQKMGRVAYDFQPGSPKGGPKWAFEGDGSMGSKPDGVVLGGNVISLMCLAPSQPGTYTLKGSYPGWFTPSLKCQVTAARAGDLVGPAMGLVVPEMEAGRLSWRWAVGPVLEDCSATLLEDGSVLVAGGWEDRASRRASDQAFRYWPASRKTVAVGPMMKGRALQEWVRLKDGRVLLYGGAGTSDGEVFDPASNTFRLVTGVTLEGFGIRLCLLKDGQVLGIPCVGEDGVQGLPGPPSAFLLDGKTLALRGTIPVLSLRENPTITALPDGGALVVGPPPNPGDPDRFLAPDPGSLTERFDAASRSFRPGPLVLRGRRDHQALAFPDGRVLILGGWSNAYASPGMSGRSLVEQAEWFDPATGAFVDGDTFRSLDTEPAAVLQDGSLLYGAGTRLFRGFPARGRAVANALIPHRMVPLPDGRVLLLSRASLATQLLYP
ncbi:Kelch repeat-containing protein [Mesoterricola silvestris]|uniref:Uncharacterized protein n=1 Tax=Mesoterricola silvestris TaxID=2927979 RepID=A0AA48GIQ5_9BACT|nr:hypothetical protein [Mesoterricola silvestris]BDU72027.1 hypothetical protein METEAL_12010 [Mesoterricola silvestris]